ncbi:hypothetical protein D9757_001542 [Collybiopsis confluens]|uniref:Uncharacterized protein n=1 Tax=Collybiopsis confluens TaxID=2823264 RepID=A0A8H5HZE8_9AGAR|nr:hypothetical protein D9757_001542 [Collybiopsis confluens]
MDDLFPQSYKYSWSSATSGISLKDYLAKFRPSMVEFNGTNPWIWVSKDEDPESGLSNQHLAMEHGSGILKDITERIESIKNDPSIPTRSNKKTGARSKKEVREELQASAAEKFKAIAQKHHYTCGKWLIFASPEKVDMIWSSIATSLIEGPLVDTPAFRAKVATTPPGAAPDYRHLICLYLPDVYDKDTVTKVMKILLRNHALILSGVKSDLYTMLGIDSKHPSGISSTIWKNKDILSEKEMQELKNEFFAGLSRKKNTTNDQATTKADAGASATPATSAAVAASSKLKPKKKRKDAFASDDEDGDDEEKQRKVELAKKKKAASGGAKRAKDDEEDDEDDVQEQPKRKSAKRS